MKEIMLITHFLGLSMGVGAAFALVFLGIAKSKTDDLKNGNILGNASTMCKMGNYGLLLSFISGGYLMTPYWANLSIMPLLIVKLVLFLVLAAMFGIMTGKIRKYNVSETQTKLGTIDKIIKLVALLTIIMVVLAVRVFH